MHTLDSYRPDPERYDGRMPQRRCGHTGLMLPEVSLGFWQNFGDFTPLATQRAMMRAAFDAGVTHFDLANNYGPPYGTAEINAGRILREDFAGLRDQLIISTKAGWDMWPGPYGDLGSRKYLLSSLDQSLHRLGVDYVDIFYSHRPDYDTPLAETMGALATAVQQGKALYVGISSYGPRATLQAAQLLADQNVPLVIHQPSYSILNRWIEHGLLDVLNELGAGCITFSPLAQGVLTSRYLHGIPADSRAGRGGSLDRDVLTDELLAALGTLNGIAEQRGQTLAQMAVAWTLRDSRVTSTIVGASSVAQLHDTLGATSNTRFSEEELAAIDACTVDAGIVWWQHPGDLP